MVRWSPSASKTSTEHVTMLMLSIFVIDWYSIPCNEMTKNMCFLSLDSIGLNSQRHLNLRLFVLNIWTNGRWMTWHRSTRRTWAAWTTWIPVPVGPSAWIYRDVQRAEQQLQASDSLCVVHILSSEQSSSFRHQIHCVLFIFFPAPVRWTPHRWVCFLIFHLIYR